ncbi:MAG: hypothetical protein HGA44_15215 [Cellulomonadaceae bacterium]|nr:hypothetical protein [Cellulomonadaceae bacterium]
MPDPARKDGVLAAAQSGRYVKRPLTAREKSLFDALDRDLAPDGVFSVRVAQRKAERAKRDATIERLIDGK